ncbi:hypothetical protein ACH46_00705 [Gordonia phthalatica]|uniref:Uncharacterized protein n=1 Tax=Gordonia phthalatica TaxID=1136941 RepID=A0A0N9NCU3_9ACTN|nr:hypothetical protein ACH46_00705 [Gordonia phthalatica]
MPEPGRYPVLDYGKSAVLYSPQGLVVCSSAFDGVTCRKQGTTRAADGFFFSKQFVGSLAAKPTS